LTLEIYNSTLQGLDFEDRGILALRYCIKRNASLYYHLWLAEGVNDLSPPGRGFWGFSQRNGGSRAGSSGKRMILTPSAGELPANYKVGGEVEAVFRFHPRTVWSGSSQFAASPPQDQSKNLNVNVVTYIYLHMRNG